MCDAIVSLLQNCSSPGKILLTGRRAAPIGKTVHLLHRKSYAWSVNKSYSSEANSVVVQWFPRWKLPHNSGTSLSLTFTWKNWTSWRVTVFNQYNTNKPNPPHTSPFSPCKNANINIQISFTELEIYVQMKNNKCII